MDEKPAKDSAEPGLARVDKGAPRLRGEEELKVRFLAPRECPVLATSGRLALAGNEIRWTARVLQPAPNALANKTARMIWAIMTSGEAYREPELRAA